MITKRYILGGFMGVCWLLGFSCRTNAAELPKAKTRASWTTAPDITKFSDEVQHLIASQVGKTSIADEARKQAERLYAELERAIIFEQNFKQHDVHAVEKAEYFLLQLSNKFALQTPLEKQERDFDGATSYLSWLWSKTKGVTQQSIDAVVQNAKNGKQWAVDQLGYVTTHLINTITLEALSNLIRTTMNLSYDVWKDVVKKILMKVTGLQEPSPEIKAIAEEAIQTCNIKQDVVVLEFPATAKIAKKFDGFVWGRFPFSFMSIKSLEAEDVSFSLLSQMFVTYHECGHLFYEDYPKTVAGITTVFPPIAAGLLTTIFEIGLSHMMRKEQQGATIMRLLVFASMIGALFYAVPAYTRTQEKRADLFACDQLIKSGRDVVVAHAISYAHGPKEDVEVEGRLTTLLKRETHPSAPEAARYLKECLHHHGYSDSAIAKLIDETRSLANSLESNDVARRLHHEPLLNLTYDGCKNVHDSCVCGNSGKRGSCSTGGRAKFGLYCSCESYELTRPVNYDGCEKMGGSCVCGNADLQGTCSPFREKTGLYCHCESKREAVGKKRKSIWQLDWYDKSASKIA